MKTILEDQLSRTIWWLMMIGRTRDNVVGNNQCDKDRFITPAS